MVGYAEKSMDDISVLEHAISVIEFGLRIETKREKVSICPSLASFRMWCIRTFSQSALMPYMVLIRSGSSRLTIFGPSRTKLPYCSWRAL